MDAGLLLVLLFAAATIPWIVRQLYPPLPPEVVDEVQAVVVLGAGLRKQAGHLAPSQRSLHRLLLASSAAQHLSLPLLISGGGRGAQRAATSEADQMRKVLGGSSLTVWLEQESNNTYENARLSAALLSDKGVQRVLLVTDRPHMTRALLCFREQGIQVKPLAVDLMPSPVWMPSAGTLLMGLEVWYEWVALGWYLLARRISLV